MHVDLRKRVAAMLPVVDLPELLMDVHSWTGMLDAYTHLGGLVSSMQQLPVTVAALLVRVPVQTINAVNDRFAGLGAIIVTGTVRDSPYILDTLLNLDAGPKPEMVATDTASYSDIVFGLFRLLGYRFSPRIADLGGTGFWRADVPASRPGTSGRWARSPATRSTWAGS